MTRANNSQKTERLNLARDLLRRKSSPDSAIELSRLCSISLRQAYRYLERAQQMKGPLPIWESKVAFTVKISRTLVEKLRGCALFAGLSLSEIVSKAVIAFLKRGAKRG